MASKFNTILIIGATSGISEAFARRFHGLGKKVIITGRRADKLDALAKELEGIETRQVCRSLSHSSSGLSVANLPPTVGYYGLVYAADPRRVAVGGLPQPRHGIHHRRHPEMLLPLRP